MATSIDATFRASGLASGMDTNSIVDQLVALEQRPITLLQNQQAGIKTQVSALADIISSLTALDTSAQDLGTNGVFANKAVSTNTSFSASPGSDAVAGRYTVQVNTLAKAAKWRSDANGFSSTDTVQGGQLTLTVQGKAYDPITIADGASLSDVAYAIRTSGAPVSAVVLSDGTKSYLSLTDRDTGFPLDKTSADALSVSFSAAANATGKPLGLYEAQPAVNASFTVDDLTFTRTTNTVTDAIPGTTLTLSKEGAGAEDLVIGQDATGTQARLQTFVTAYNKVMGLVQRQLNVNKDTDRSKTLAGDTAVRSLQGQLQDVLTSFVGTSSVRSLADLGVKTARDGSLSIDSTVLQAAIGRDPASVNALFNTAGTGLAAAIHGLVQVQTRSGDGVLVSDQAGLNKRVTDIDDQVTAMQSRIDAYKKNLIAQFTAMENTVSGLKNMGSYLTQWSNQSSSSNG